MLHAEELAGMRDEAEALGMSEVKGEVEQLRQTTEVRIPTHAAIGCLTWFSPDSFYVLGP
jgi:hypothetical protein